MEKPRNKFHLLMASIIGNILEWYDFAVYGYLATVIGFLFFPAQNTTTAVLSAFSVFAVGYLARPLGGLILGQVGDKYGRSVALRISMYIMGLSTFLMGLLPTYGQVGILATLLLVCLRIVQGISAGGEIVSSMVYVFEVSPSKSKAFWCSWVTFSCTVGVLLGSLAVSILYNQLTTAEIQQGGWRIPYLCGIFLALFGIIARKFLYESEEFKARIAIAPPKKFPILEVFKHSPKQVLQITGLNVFVSISFYTLFTWVPTYLHMFFKDMAEKSFIISTIAMVVLVLLTPMAAFIGDKVGRKRTASLCALLMIIFSYPLFQLISTGHFSMIVAALLIFAVIFSLIEGTTAAITSSIFSPDYRLSGMGIAHNISMSIFGGTAPLICSYLISKTGWISAPAIYISLSAIVGMLALVSMIRDQRKVHSTFSKDPSKVHLICEQIN